MGFFGKIVNIIGAIGAIVGISRKKTNGENGNNFQSGKRKKTIYEFTNLVKANFGSEYEIVDNYHPSNIYPNYEYARPYTMAFFQGGRLVLTILFTNHNEDRSRYFKDAKKVCEENGITCLNFFSHFENADDYVISRIGEHLHNY